MLWRVHSDAVNSALLARWLPGKAVERLLKTDVFDEAVGTGLYPLLASRAQAVIGMDVSDLTARSARSHHTELRAAAADVRHLPFADSVFDIIVSNSTLDHFESQHEVVASIRELHRVLKTGGQLLITMDNLANPVIALRNLLPVHLLNRLSLVPYYVGATCGPRRLRCILEQTGFNVLGLDAIMHHPSVLAVATAYLLQRYAAPSVQRRFLQVLMLFERLSRWPTRFLTGHYVAAKAMKL